MNIEVLHVGPLGTNCYVVGMITMFVPLLTAEGRQKKLLNLLKKNI